MARINFEDSIYKNPFFAKLILRIGDEYKAKGMLLTAFELAQFYWLKHGAIPSDKWPEDLDVLIDLKFAEIRKEDSGTFIYVSGSKEACSFLTKMSAAGKKGGKSKNPDKLKHLRQYALNDEKDRNVSVRSPKQNTEASEISNSISNSYSNSYSNSGSSSNLFPKAQKKLNSEIWDAYSQSYAARYNKEPVRNASVNSKISQIAKRLGEDAVEVIKFYVLHNDNFYLKKMHDVGLCLKDAEALHTQWVRGKAVTSKDVLKFEKTLNDFDLKEKLDKGGF